MAAHGAQFEMDFAHGRLRWQDRPECRGVASRARIGRRACDWGRSISSLASKGPYVPRLTRARGVTRPPLPGRVRREHDLAWVQDSFSQLSSPRRGGKRQSAHCFSGGSRDTAAQGGVQLSLGALDAGPLSSRPPAREPQRTAAETGVRFTQGGRQNAKSGGARREFFYRPLPRIAVGAPVSEPGPVRACAPRRNCTPLSSLSHE